MLSSLPVGGIEAFVLNLSHFLSKYYCNVFIFQYYPHVSNENFVKSRLSKDVRLISFPNVLDKLIWWIDGKLERNLSWKKARFHTSIRSILDKIYFFTIIKINRIDVIHSHNRHIDNYIYHNRFKTFPPFVISMHGTYDFEHVGEYELGGTQQELIAEATHTLNYSNRIIYCAEKNKWITTKTLIKTPFEKIFYGYPSFSKVKQRPQTFTFGMIARGELNKGWEQLISAFLLLQKEYPFIQLKLAYSASDEFSFLKEKFQMIENITFLGQQDNVESFLQNIHVGLLPTYFWAESLPNTIIEYLNSGIPAISTIVGDIPEMLKTSNNELAGQLIPLEADGKPSVEKLYLAMKTYLEDEALYKYHCELAEDAFQKFDMATCAQKYMAVYEEVIQEKKTQLRK